MELCLYEYSEAKITVPATNADESGINLIAGNLCGNGRVDVDPFNAEECDDGNLRDNDQCTSLCKIATCGDGVVQVGVEECDDGNFFNTDACTNDCKKARCGDNYVYARFEECDNNTDESCVNCRQTGTIRYNYCAIQVRYGQFCQLGI